jgi:hypothetical protein
MAENHQKAGAQMLGAVFQEPSCMIPETLPAVRTE